MSTLPPYLIGEIVVGRNDGELLTIGRLKAFHPLRGAPGYPTTIFIILETAADETVIVKEIARYATEEELVAYGAQVLAR